MTISLAGATGVSTTAAARGTTSTTVAFVAVAAGRLAVITASVKPSTATWDTDPAGWTKVTDDTGGTGTDATDTGTSRIGKWHRILDGSESGSVTIAATNSPSQVCAAMDVYERTLPGWAVPISNAGSDITHTTNATGASGSNWSSGLRVGDWVHAGYATDTSSSTAISSQSMTQSGVTFGTKTARSRVGNSSGTHGAVITWDAPVTAVTSAGVGNPSLTLSWTATSCGATGALRIREIGAPISTVVDDFDDNTIASPPWSDNYGSATETGGRARTPTTTSYSAYSTDFAYALDAAGFSVQAFPAAVNGASSGEVYTSAWLNSEAQGAGTQIGFKVDTRAGNITFEDQTSYFDAGKTTLTYNSTAHAYWRLQLVGTDLVWSTSPDNATWTTQRTSTAPGYVAGALDFRLFLESHRDSGTNNFAEWDNLNVSTAVSGTATVTGAGSVTATATQQSGATVTGAGSVTAVATQAAGATITGAGSVTASAGGVVNGTATITGAGSVTAAATLRAGASITGAGAVTALASQSAGASITAAGTVTAAGSGATFGTASVTGAGTVTALAVQSATASATGAGSVTANAGGQVSGTASVVGAGAVAALATVRSGATVAAAGTVTAAGSNTGSASVVGAGAVTALARIQAGAAALAAGQVTASASVGAVIYGTASVVGAGFVTATAGSRITPRPFAGVTSRPFAGVTPRP